MQTAMPAMPARARTSSTGTVEVLGPLRPGFEVVLTERLPTFLTTVAYARYVITSTPAI